MQIHLLVVFLLFFYLVRCDHHEDEEIEVVDTPVDDEFEPEEEVAEEELVEYAPFAEPIPQGDVIFFDNFQSGVDKWVLSTNERYTGTAESSPAVGDVVAWEEDLGILLAEPAKFYGHVASFKPFTNKDKTLVVQYEVKFEKRADCGGTYLKLLFADSLAKAEDFVDSSPFAIMFGPDVCGTVNKVHFIFRFQNPVSGVWEEKHLTEPPKVKNDMFTHLYTLVIRPDNTFEIRIDEEIVREGSLFEEFLPAVVPPKEIDDPDDSQPEDWVEDEYMDDPDAVKPDDWDEDEPQFIIDPDDEKPEDWEDDAPAMVPDPEAEMPEEWDEEEDGEWEAPMVPNPICELVGCGEWKRREMENPLFRGKWTPPQIKNPDYIGIWHPEQIENPDYFTTEDAYIFDPIGYVGIDVWQMTSNVLFDNVIIADNDEVVKQFAGDSYAIKAEIEEAKAPKAPEIQADSGAAFFDMVMEAMEKVPLPVLIGVGALVLISPLLLCLCRSGKVEREDDDEEEEGEDGSSDDGSGSSEEEEEPTPIPDDEEETPEDAGEAEETEPDEAPVVEETTRRKKRRRPTKMVE